MNPLLDYCLDCCMEYTFNPKRRHRCGDKHKLCNICKSTKVQPGVHACSNCE
jgi:hypothetical protein